MFRILLVCLSVSAIAVDFPAYAQESAPAEEAVDATGKLRLEPSLD